MSIIVFMEGFLVESAGLVFGNFFQFLVGPDGDLHPAVLSPAFRCLVAGDRIGLAVAFGAKTGPVDILGGLIGSYHKNRIWLINRSVCVKAFQGIQALDRKQWWVQFV